MFSLLKCPRCQKSIEDVEHTKSMGHVFVTMFKVDVVMSLAAAILFAISLKWIPALFFGLAVSMYIVFRKETKIVYSCKHCGRKIKFDELYK